MSTAGIDATIVPYKDIGEVQVGLVRDDITVGFESYAALKGAIDDKQIRAIATSGTSRSLPDVPTVKETGALDYEVTGWNAIFAPAAPRRTSSPSSTARSSQSWRCRISASAFSKLGTEPRRQAPEENRRAAEGRHLSKWGGVIDRAKIEKR